jgi:hypothetical protein
MFKYEITIPKGAKSLTLPTNQNIRIFAISVANNGNDDLNLLQPLYDDFKDNKPSKLR